HVAGHDQDGLCIWTEGSGITRHGMRFDSDGPFDAVAVAGEVWIAHTSGNVVSLDGRPIATLPRAPALAAGGGRAIAVCGAETFELGDRGVQPLPRVPERICSNVAWDGERFVVVAGEGPSVPHALGPDGWVRCGEPIEPARRFGLLLARDTIRGELIAYGGSETEPSMQTSLDETVLLASRRRVEGGWSRQHGRYDSLHQVGDATVVLSHTHLRALRITAGGFVPWVRRVGGEARPTVDDRVVRACGSPEALWVIDDRGRPWRSSGGAWETAGEGDASIAVRDGGALAWDPVAGALVLAGGPRRNDTWLMRPGRGWWQEPPSGLPAGEAALASTPRGVYAFVPPELWLHADGGWRLCAKDATCKSAHRRRLLYDPTRDALLSISGDYETQVVRVWAPDGPRRHETLPLRQARAVAPAHAAVGVAPELDRLLVVDRNRVWARDLSSLGAGRIGLPDATDTPRRARSRPSKKKKKTFSRPAWRLVPGNRVVEIEGLPLPDDHIFLAWLPASDRLPLGPHASIAISMAEDIWSLDPATPHSPAFAVVLHDERPPGPVIDALLADEVPFDDPDPTKLEQMDAGPGWDLAGHTKIGGYANLIQGGAEEQARADTCGRCRRCGKALVYRVQLSAGAVDVGDCGRVWVYVCPDGCDAAAVAQSL
ncbi:MAG: hypothetical protein IT379_39850, partial [Deltaproteobacteria bacterium]|nr:hypothetical protein [Deltaproteobacteria bacterium]